MVDGRDANTLDALGNMTDYWYQDSHPDEEGIEEENTRPVDYRYQPNNAQDPGGITHGTYGREDKYTAERRCPEAMLSRYYQAFTGAAGSMAIAARNAIDRLVSYFSDRLSAASSFISSMANSIEGREGKTHRTLYEAVSDYLSTSPAFGNPDSEWMKHLILGYASYIDNKLKKAGYDGIFSVSTGPLAFGLDNGGGKTFHYGKINIRHGPGGTEYRITLNSILEGIARYSVKARRYLAETLTHEMTHVLGTVMGTQEEGVINAIAAEYFRSASQELGNSELANHLLAVYSGKAKDLPLSYRAMGLFATYVNETREALSRYGHMIKHCVGEAMNHLRPYLSNVLAPKAGYNSTGSGAYASAAETRTQYPAIA